MKLAHKKLLSTHTPGNENIFTNLLIQSFYTNILLNWHYPFNKCLANYIFILLALQEYKKVAIMSHKVNGTAGSFTVYNHKHIWLTLKFKYRCFIFLYYHTDQHRPFQLHIQPVKQLHANSMKGPFKACTFTWGGQHVKVLLLQFTNQVQPSHGKIWSLTKAGCIFLMFRTLKKPNKKLKPQKIPSFFVFMPLRGGLK